MARSAPASPRRKAADGNPAPERPGGGHASGRSSGSVTLSDVAKLAGVSPITVSRVLNRPELVTRDTIEIVRQAIARTGYVPNLLAGGLASRRSRLVAAIVPTISSSMFAETVEALTDKLAEAGYQVLLGLSGYPAVREDDLLDAILGRRPDGILLTGIMHSHATRRRLLAAGIPVVEIWDYTPTPIDALVGFSHERAGEAVARHLLAKGHRRLAVIGADDDRAMLRRKGFRAAIAGDGAGQGVADAATVTVPAPGTLRTGREAMARLLESDDRPDAVFCSSDIVAQGALAEALSRGLSVPGDLAVMGFGDLDFAAHTFPALSTVRIDRRAMGRIAAETLLARMEGRTDLDRVIDIGFEVIERAST
ncbi:LacI family DNA-binding transcriptional regulator (plasmid) [Skermanella mucosa]|uniref:LacI family DNA-binding transcriptional regulator n=1 Tax=Skermanella mucosa TaxID=1789672 RepID=UPI001E51E059|nr:LacI family DNA-binding transcriptional regulator [Skermanella mucosa]UEM24609.1 LacI family DNA-binding transcriptional regulator [Skermanella mucosa]